MTSTFPKLNGGLYKPKQSYPQGGDKPVEKIFEKRVHTFEGSDRNRYVTTTRTIGAIMEKQHEATITLTYTQANQLKCAIANRIAKSVTTTPFEEKDDYFYFVMDEMMSAHSLLEAEVDRLGDLIEDEMVAEFATNLDQEISKILK